MAKWPLLASIGVYYHWYSTIVPNIVGFYHRRRAHHGISGMRPSPLKSQRISHISCFFITSAPGVISFTQPIFTQPIFTQSIFTQPIFTQPIFTQPIFTQPIFTQSNFTQPIFTQPIFTQPIFARPIFTQLIITESIFTQLLSLSPFLDKTSIKYKLHTYQSVFQF